MKRKAPVGRLTIPQLVAVLIPILLLIVAALPPFLGEGAARTIARGFSFVCHQLPERTFAVGDTGMAICHRCFGIYGGVAAGAAVFPLLVGFHRVVMRYVGPILIVSLAPMTIDWLGDVVGVFSNTIGSRMITGAAFGVVAGFLFARAIDDLGTDRSPAALVDASPDAGQKTHTFR